MDDLATLRDAATGNWRHILLTAGVDENLLSGKKVPCPKCGGNTRFSYTNKWNHGDGVCHHCGHLDGFGILSLHLGSFRAAVSHVRNLFAGGSSVVGNWTPEKNGILSEDEVARRLAKIQNLWNAGGLIRPNDPAFKYIQNRVPGLENIPDVLRSHRGLEYFEKDQQGNFKKTGRFPGMLAKVQGADGSLINVRRYYLTANGEKAPVGEPKKAMPSIGVNHGAVRLFPATEELAIAEGIETALSVFLFSGKPCWSVLDTAGMENFVVPADHRYVRKVSIYADNDTVKQGGKRPGQEAAYALKARLDAQGIHTRILLPAKTGMDFNDLIKTRRVQ